MVLCNCDDPFESNFFKYFATNFNHLGLKKLICTCYEGSSVSHTELKDLPLLSKAERLPYMIEITEVPDLNNDGATDFSDIELLLRSNNNVLTLLDGDGDFRSEESIELLKEADIVVTNPPFSLFREYVAQLIKFDKKFLIIGNMNAITYKETFALIKANKMWGGYKKFSGGMNMIFPSSIFDVSKIKKYEIDNDGNIIVNIMGVIWYTNLDIEKRHEKMILYKHYSPEEYHKYENFDAINIDRVTDIPDDYYGPMGVPITFLDKYNPEQFELIGLGISNSGLEVGVKPYSPEHKKYRKEVQHRGAVDGDLYMLDENGHPDVPYARIIIQRATRLEK